MSGMKPPIQGLHRQAIDWMMRNAEQITPANRAKEDINVIRESLDSVQATDRKRMPERIFVGLWLPFFYEGQNKYYPQLNFAMWANFAGNEYREVDVFNPKTGEVLYVVPPCFDRGGIRSLEGKDRGRVPGGNILNVIRNAELKSRVSPIDGTHYLNAMLKQRALVMGNIPDTVRVNIERWNHIFKRYGLKPLVETEELTQSPNSLSTTSSQVTSNDDWELL